MVRRAGALVAVLLAGSVQAEPATALRLYEGEARDPDSGRLLYTEQHLVRLPSPSTVPAASPQERLVLYRCPDGELFARKQVDYREGWPAAPTFRLEDGRFGYREGVRAEQDTLLAFLRRDSRSPERRGSVAPSARLVVDAGFDEFVRAGWTALQSGKTLALDFLVPSRLGTYGFTLRRIGVIDVEGQPASQFRLSLGGVLGWFAPDITVTYRDSDQRLLRFEGLTNIRADREENLVARIDFPDARGPRPAGPGDWAAALAEPLTACEPGS